MTSEKCFELSYKLKKYLKEYGKYYSPTTLQYVEENFIKEFEESVISTTLLQAYEECGLSDELPTNIYKNFINHIKKDCDIDANLLEVGGGIIPSLAKSLRKEQVSGSITVMDPITKIKEYGDLKILKRPFSEFTDVSDYSLIFSNFPCKVTDEILRSSYINDIDIYLQLCGCTNGRSGSYNEYISYIISLLNELSNGSDRRYEMLQYKDLYYPIVRTFK